MTRRRLLGGTLLLAGGVLGVGCAREQSQPAAVARPTATPEPTLEIPRQSPPRPTPTVVPTLVPLAPATELLDPQSRVIPPLAPRPSSLAARTLPPQRLVIPSIALDARIIPIGIRRDKDGNPVWETAPFAVGHHVGSANPGEPGNVVLSGHISSPREGAVFQQLPRVKPGDGLVVATSQQQFLYRVRDVSIVAPDAVELLDATPIPVVTLITCYPDGVYSQRLIVRAEAV